MIGVLTLSACSSTAKTTVSLDPVVTYKDQSLSKNDLYQTFVYNGDVYSIALTKAINSIGPKELEESAIEAEITKVLDTYIASQGDALESKVQAAGFDSIEHFKQEAIRPQAIQTLLVEKYLVDQKDSILKEFKFRAARYISFESEDEAKAAIKALNDGTATWEAFASSRDATDLSLVYKGFTDSKTGVATIEAILGATKEGLMDKPVKANSVFTVIEIVDLGSESLDEKIKLYSSEIKSISNASLLFYFEKNNITFHDQRVQKQFDAVYRADK